MEIATSPRRRRASQARSIATVQKILDATHDLIVERGAAAVTMSDIARRAGLVIGSLYQYFVDKSAIFREILIRHQAESRALLHHHVAQAQSFEQLVDALVRSFDDYYALLQRDRLIAGLWPMVQTDPELQALDMQDTLQNARHVAAIAERFVTGISTERLIAAYTLLIQFSMYAGQLALEAPAETAREIPPAFRTMLRDSLGAMAQPPKT
jgi:AcrR family transcriptional regulator